MLTAPNTTPQVSILGIAVHTTQPFIVANSRSDGSLLIWDMRNNRYPLATFAGTTVVSSIFTKSFCRCSLVTILLSQSLICDFCLSHQARSTLLQNYSNMISQKLGQELQDTATVKVHIGESCKNHLWLCRRPRSLLIFMIFKPDICFNNLQIYSMLSNIVTRVLFEYWIVCLVVML